LTSDDANLAHFLRRHAQERPGAVAVRTPLSLGPSGEIAHASLTFGELDRRTDAVARLLRASGIGKGTRVLLALRPGEQLLVGFHGLLKVGAVPVAIDPGMGWRAALTGIARTRPEALLGIRKACWLSRLPLDAFRSLRLRLDVESSDWARMVAAAESPKPGQIEAMESESPAAIAFTSGSTGSPKGVRLTHGMLRAQVELVRRLYGMGPGDLDFPLLPAFSVLNPALGQGTVTPRPCRQVPHRAGRARANRHSVQVPLELLGHLMGRGEALRWVGVHAAQAQDLEVEGHVRPDRARLGRPTRANVLEHLQRIRAQMGRASREHLVEDGAEPVDVGACGEGIHAVARNLRGHEGGGADGPDGAGAGDGVVEVAGEAEVAELGVVVVGEQDVAGLDVSMQDAGVVGAGEGQGDRQGPACGLLGRRRLVGEPLGQRSPLDELHLDEAPAVVLPGGMDLHDRPVVETREDPRFRQEPLHGAVTSTRVGLGREDLDGARRLEA